MLDVSEPVELTRFYDEISRRVKEGVSARGGLTKVKTVDVTEMVKFVLGEIHKIKEPRDHDYYTSGKDAIIYFINGLDEADGWHDKVIAKILHRVKWEIDNPADAGINTGLTQGEVNGDLTPIQPSPSATDTIGGIRAPCRANHRWSREPPYHDSCSMRPQPSAKCSQQTKRNGNSRSKPSNDGAQEGNPATRDKDIVNYFAGWGDDHRHDRRVLGNAVPGWRDQGVPGYIGDGSRITCYFFFTYLKKQKG